MSASLTPEEVAGLVERLRGIPVKWIDLRMGEEPADAIEALTAALASERVAHAETKRERDEAFQKYVDANEAKIDAEAQLAEARKAQRYLNDGVFVGLPDQEIARRARLLVEAARRALTGGKNG